MRQDGDALIAEYDSTGTLLRRYVHGARVDSPLVWYDGSAANDAHYFHADHQGSIIAVSDAAGDLVASNTYSPFGVPSNTAFGRCAYTGQIELTGLDLYDYKARIYDPALGRFLQTDPIGYEDQMNLYAYVANDPVNATDPDGLQARPVPRPRPPVRRPGREDALRDRLGGHQVTPGQRRSEVTRNYNEILRLQGHDPAEPSARNNSRRASITELVQSRRALNSAQSEFRVNHTQSQQLREVSMFRQITEGRGNFGISGPATRAEANKAGVRFVGPGYTASRDGSTINSRDVTRGYRYGLPH